MLRLNATLVVMMLISTHVFAAVKTAGIFGDNMVLQRDQEIPVWGWAEPGELIKVEFAGQQAEAVTGNDGAWMVKLKPLPVSAKPLIMTIRGKKDVLKINDILVGEVWLCSGQSNMGIGMAYCVNAAEEIKKADYPEIRFLQIPLVSSFARRPDMDRELAGGWKICAPMTLCSPKITGGFSAVGYFFGREIYRELNVPVGLIAASWGGTPVVAWTSPQTVENEFKNIADDYTVYREKREKELGFMPGDSEKVQDWSRTAKEFDTIEKIPERLNNAQGVYRRIPCGLFNGMIAPLIPFAIRGVIWYQGEDDVGSAWDYRKRFRAMIRDWRRHWGEGDFPFYFVQLANWDSSWTLTYAELRESQQAVLDEPGVGMAVAIDIGDPKNVHPKNKQEVGRRLALNALAKTYGRKLEYSGPLYRSMKIEGDKVRITFDYVHGGLMIKNGELTGFTIAGENPEMVEIVLNKDYKDGARKKIRKFYPAKAEIDGNTVLVWSKEIARPTAVRYGWANAPECNLYNKAGLPAAPFRTDDWPGITH
ncbi:MAG: sialate O-acetylesterase [Verrucomicrobia bacterium]|nr:sialate O-acetylesterase [Verrucomicrobiota bacterium]MBU1734644.1 sialate O-acetylesterase [Verrucomicrobiota bacterium]MBU1855362.1 sialate O-acetylesterase [Verrucomicrobiota bacterium]